MEGSFINRLDGFFEERTKSKEESQRLLVYLLAIAAGVIGYPLHILGVWGSGDIVLQAISITTEACLIIDFTLYYKKEVSLFHAFAAYGFMMLALQSAKILYISHMAFGGGTYLILFNFFICLLVIFLMVMGYMHVIPFYLTGICFLTSIAANIIRPGAIQNQFVLFFIFICILECALGMVSWRNLHDVEKENKDLHEEETGILSAFNMSRDELMAYIAMSKKKDQTEKDVNDFFDNLDERTEHNIVKAVKKRETMVRMKNADVSNAFPMLSPTECDVCRLVMGGKTMKEIARLTGKTVNNVGAVRIHIRKKLNLTSDQNLRQYLEESMKG